MENTQKSGKSAVTDEEGEVLAMDARQGRSGWPR